MYEILKNKVTLSQAHLPPFWYPLDTRLWTPELVWTLWRENISFPLARNETTIPWLCSPKHCCCTDQAMPAVTDITCVYHVFSQSCFQIVRICPNLTKCNCNWCEHEDTLTGQHTRFNKFMNELILKLNYMCYAIRSFLQLHRPCSVERPIIQLFLHNVSIIKVHSIEWQTTPNKYSSSILNYDAVSFSHTSPPTN
jgi:hypothetical protein